MRNLTLALADAERYLASFSEYLRRTAIATQLNSARYNEHAEIVETDAPSPSPKLRPFGCICKWNPDGSFYVNTRCIRHKRGGDKEGVPCLN